MPYKTRICSPFKGRIVHLMVEIEPGVYKPLCKPDKYTLVDLGKEIDWYGCMKCKEIFANPVIYKMITGKDLKHGRPTDE